MPARYLENEGADAFFKPWMWIVFLFIFPILQAMVSESYLYISVCDVHSNVLSESDLFVF